MKTWNEMPFSWCWLNFIQHSLPNRYTYHTSMCSIYKANNILKTKNIDCFWGYDKKKYWPLLNTNSHDTFLSDKSCHKICFMRLYSLEVLRQQTRNYMNLCKSYFEKNIPYKSFNHVRVLSDYKNIWNKNRNSQRHTTISFHVSFILYFWPFNSFVSLFLIKWLTCTFSILMSASIYKRIAREWMYSVCAKSCFKSSKCTILNIYCDGVF